MVTQCTEVRFASFLSGGFTTMAVIIPPKRKLAKRTSVHCFNEVCKCHQALRLCTLFYMKLAVPIFF